MDIKKILTLGAGAACLSLVAACSSDDKSDNNPVDPGTGTSSEVVANSSSGTVAGSSSSQNSALVSSSSLTESDAPQMACSELMYHSTDSLEWVEIYIAGGSDMDNMKDRNLHLSGDVDYVFPEEPLAKGEYVVVTNDTTKFRTEYPTFTGRLFGPMTKKMSNEGGVVNVKVLGEGDVTCAYSSEPPWPSLADGKGHSLVYKGGIASQSVAWCASATPNGNPGVGNDACIDVMNTVRINEVKPSVDASGAYEASWIELYNSGSTDVDVSGWTLFVKLRKNTVTINSGTVVPAGGYLLIDGATGFDKELMISNLGGEIYLYGTVSGQESSIWLPAGNSTTGIVDVADGSIAQGPLTTATPGEANSSLKLGSVYINEIHYHPSEKGNVAFEFLELVNATAAPITLYNSFGGWKIEGVNLTFASTDVIPANGVMLLLPDTSSVVSDTAYFRTKFEMGSNVPFKIYDGKLSNRGETIAVKEPYSMDADKKVYYTWHDAVLYSDAWAGLTNADGFGYSLHRTDVTTMGYSPSAWEAATPTPGTK